MPRTRLKVCSCGSCPAHPRSCPELTDRRYCPGCTAEHERARGTRQARGYDRHHDQLRKHWKPKVEAGLVDCHAPTCTQPIRRILPGQPWDLGHTTDRSGWRGPEHAPCNRAEGGRAAHH
jgi:hypothetical protein